MTWQIVAFRSDRAARADHRLVAGHRAGAGAGPGGGRGRNRAERARRGKLAAAATHPGRPDPCLRRDRPPACAPRWTGSRPSRRHRHPGEQRRVCSTAPRWRIFPPRCSSSCCRPTSLGLSCRSGGGAAHDRRGGARSSTSPASRPRWPAPASRPTPPPRARWKPDQGHGHRLGEIRAELQRHRAGLFRHAAERRAGQRPRVQRLAATAHPRRALGPGRGTVGACIFLASEAPASSCASDASDPGPCPLTAAPRPWPISPALPGCRQFVNGDAACTKSLAMSFTCDGGITV
jgi:hypothetical protein